MMAIDYSLLPNFMVIGATKAGTTSLHDVLDQHPQIFCTKVKEPGFFSAEKRYLRGLEWYQETFFKNAGGYPRRGESTGAYLHWGRISAPRIQAAYAGRELKLIAILRDPVKRAYSYYQMQVRNKAETLSFEEALAQEDERVRTNLAALQRIGLNQYGYYLGGCYATLLEPFLERFPPRDFHFLLLDDFNKDFPRTMERLAVFLDVQVDFTFQPVQSNVSTALRSKTFHRFLHQPSGPLHRVIRLFTHRLSFTTRHQVKKQAIKANLRPQEYSPMKAETAARLRERYLPEIERLEQILGRDLSAWKTG